MKPAYSEPKIYTGGVAISDWKSLTKKQQQVALSKDWYVYFSFRNPETGKLERQANIKAGANVYKTKRQRLQFLKVIQRNLLLLLEAGFNPYKDNSELEAQFLHQTPNSKTKKPTLSSFPKKEHEISVANSEHFITIEKALDLVLKTKERSYKKTSYTSFSNNVSKFHKWLLTKNYKNSTPIIEIDKKCIIDYLNYILLKTSARTRNNTRTDLSVAFQTLEDNDIIKDNFVKKINVLKATPKRHKKYNQQQLELLHTYMEEQDPLLLLFVKFISFNYLRPIEVCRLQIKDVNINEKQLYVKAKNSPVKIKIIPDILLKVLPDLSEFEPNHFLFTPEKIGGEWNTNEKDKRDYFSKRFKKVKQHFNLGSEYGLYSFRHTYITKLYNAFIQDLTPYETKSKLMLITGHKTMDALEKYLRDIDAVLPEDYSDYLKQ